MIRVETPRLILREWRESDLEPFASMNADPRVMEYFPGTMSFDDTRLAIQRVQEIHRSKDIGWFAVELRETGEFIGFNGLSVPRQQLPFGPCVEIGWRLAFEHWNKGYATEGALASLKYGFETSGLKEIVSFTTVSNLRSRKVMEKIGMTYDPNEDFDHPSVPAGHPLQRHVLYRLSAPIK